MPFLFSHVCDLLQQAADLPLVRRVQPDSVQKLIRDWFNQHRPAIDALIHDSSAGAVDGAASAAAILSALLPDHRTDRVYGIQAKSLQRIIARALGLGHSRIAELARWTRPPVDGDAVDLADCVECILRRTPNSLDGPSVYIEDIDAILNGLAANCRFSSPAIRQISQAPASRDSAVVPSAFSIANAADSNKSVLMRDRVLGHLYRRLSARDAKWLTRLILKDYRPIVLDQATVFRAFHPAFPLALRVHSDFVTAMQSLGQGDTEGQEQQEGKPVSQSGASSGFSGCLATQPKVSRAYSHCPRLGVKVGRQPWAKARSIKHCLAMGKGRRMSCERKLDGEYVQVHVDLSKGRKNCLQLFSKSGKDSTRDRFRVHNCIRASLRIDEDDCPLSTGCILEGEMLAFSEKKETCHAERFRRLQELIICRPGYAELVYREVIDFGSRAAAEKLRQSFSSCISAHHEGLVLKAESDTYFDFSPPGSGPLEWPYMRCYAIKLKKGYVGQFGEFHFDRTYMDVITFDDLQTVARDESLRKPEVETDGELQEDDLISHHDFAETGHENGEERTHWATQLKHTDSGGIAVDADTSQSSAVDTASTTSEAASRLPDQIAIPIVVRKGCIGRKGELGATITPIAAIITETVGRASAISFAAAEFVGAACQIIGFAQSTPRGRP
ncbi:ATP dependent DNA ligase domain containing protein [Grosmannia clavigera kw1407]|uniref:ATP dependent DNA ligase domain containing protein n=1 Tax=Grosmannia clavigera (strain kw1407 / UAMH 11150) TaxID=655863 RepID=F0XJP4_GROCL|nr:ATP dependent DNA ligase domain containing protein [Grosmannia clavigera kw1407]EFX02445.1 ATP dependent DNA ligase domain containing protein [Grosmannia clavigera kw1407]